MKKVLIITYYWPPSGGPGVQRVLKFAKYLPEFGWEPHVLTVKTGEFPAIDESLLEEIPDNCRVIKTDSFEPNILYKKFTKKDISKPLPVAMVAKEAKSWKEKLAKWIRLNIFIPDAKICWKPYAVRKGKKIINKINPDIILSSSPPPTAHLIAKKLAKYGKIPWIADFRDPWTKIYHYDGVTKFVLAKKIDAYLERNVVRYSSQCVTVSTDFANLIGGSEYQKKFTIIPNGYDHMDIADISQNNNSSKFSIAYAGKLNPQQNPLNLWRALKELIENEDFAKNFQLIFIGIIDDNIKAKIIELGLNKYTYFTGYLPHKEAISVLSQSTVLLLINPDTKLNKGIVPGKLFEYLVLKKFIISISSKGSKIEQILNQTNSGKNYSFSDSLKDEILLQYTNWKKKIKINPNLEEITKYSRKNLTAQLAEIMESLV